MTVSLWCYKNVFISMEQGKFIIVSISLGTAATPVGKRGAATAAAAAIAQRAASSPEGDISAPIQSPAPRRRGRPRKNPVMELTSVEDESTLFSIVRNGKSSLQVRVQFY